MKSFRHETARCSEPLKLARGCPQRTPGKARRSSGRIDQELQDAEGGWRKPAWLAWPCTLGALPGQRDRRRAGRTARARRAEPVRPGRGRECNRAGVVVDCAHASFATAMAVLEVSRQSLADFSAEIIRLAGAAGPARVAIGTDPDGNYRPVLASYSQLADLAGLLREGGLPADRIRQILGGNAADLLRRTIPRTAGGPSLKARDGKPLSRWLRSRRKRKPRR
jgi:hypothetical protein